MERHCPWHRHLPYRQHPLKIQGRTWSDLRGYREQKQKINGGDQMKNIKRQLVNYRNAMVMHMWNVKNKLQDTSGEGYVDTAIKILIAVVLGALLLAGLYALFNDTVLPTLVRRVQEMFDYSG
jgi:hypothetical protein